MISLARQGLYTKVLCISYPLAPEQPFPAAVAAVAAAFAWLGMQFPAGCGTSIIPVGDSAGGNLTASSLAALKDYLQQQQQQQPAEQQQPVLAALGQQQEEPPATSILQAVAATITDSNNSSISTAAPAAGSSAAVPEAAAAAAAPAGAAQHSTSQASTGGVGTGSVTGNSIAAAETAAIEAKLFADLHHRLTAAGITNSMMNSSSPATAGLDDSLAAAPSAEQVAAVRIPTAIILASPATDISPTAHFRGGSGTSQVDALGVGSGTNGPGSGTDSTPHYDYLPRNVESGGMGSCAEHHEALCGVYASPVHLTSFEGLCEGRWLVLAGEVELLAPGGLRHCQASAYAVYGVP